MAGRYRNLCITVNAQEGEELRLLDPTLIPGCTYLIQSREYGGNTHHEHLQCYAEFERAVTFATLHKAEGLEDAHFEPRRGTQKQAIDYCMPHKGGAAAQDPTYIEGPFIWGEPKHQGQRNDILDAVSDLKGGASLKRVALDHPEVYVKFHSGLSKYQMLTAVPRGEEPTLCFVLYGSGGAGKSTFARRLAHFLDEEDRGVYQLPFAKGSGLYWDRYEQGQVVIIDEFKGDRCKPTFFNSLVDKGPFEVPVHGGTTQFNSKYIIITTNVAPRQWWPQLEFQRSLRRRIILWPIFRNLSYRPLPPPMMLYQGNPVSISSVFRNFSE